MPAAAFGRSPRKRLLLAGTLLAPCIATASPRPDAIPILTFSPLTPTTLTLPDTETAVVQYQVTNQSTRSHTFAMQPIQGVTMLAESGDCAAPFSLDGSASCVLDLQLVGSAMQGDIVGGPVVCDTSNALQCYQPSAAAQLHVTLVHPAVASIAVDPSSVSVPVGSIATITVLNVDQSLAALNLRIDVPANSAITVVSGTCPPSLPPGSDCTFDIAGATPETATVLTIAGDNVTAASVTATVFDDAIFADGFDAP